MAIKNASDLLVYAKTDNPAQQVTRIYVIDDNPVSFSDGTGEGKLKINNITNSSGVVFDNVESV